MKRQDRHFPIKYIKNRFIEKYRERLKSLFFFKCNLKNCYLEMEKLSSGTKVDENTGCAGPASDTKKVCILHFYSASNLV